MQYALISFFRTSSRGGQFIRVPDKRSDEVRQLNGNAGVWIVNKVALSKE